MIVTMAGTGLEKRVLKQMVAHTMMCLTMQKRVFGTNLLVS